MCKLEDILKTELRMPLTDIQTEKGISSERIAFNTDVMFAVAKKMEMPLDKTADLMRQKGMFKTLHKAYAIRHKEGVVGVSKLISKSLQEA